MLALPTAMPPAVNVAGMAASACVSVGLSPAVTISVEVGVGRLRRGDASVGESKGSCRGGAKRYARLLALGGGEKQLGQAFLRDDRCLGVLPAGLWGQSISLARLLQPTQ